MFESVAADDTQQGEDLVVELLAFQALAAEGCLHSAQGQMERR